MSHPFWLVLVALVSGLLWITEKVHALTPEEVLKLKAAGVSEETIQMMLQYEFENNISQEKIEQGYTTDHMGTWKLKDGRTITSTGKRQLPLHYPTEYPPPSPYAPFLSPYIVMPPTRGWRSTPSLESPASSREPTQVPSPSESPY